ncbi:MAG: tRNA-dihydrouridine synthase [Bacteroidales bacterium]|nr:tRNA-dihydrouridine synthase [Bacteroidales bacterium]MCF8406098.1 tRNA-dihydrouridine synthase [Bacteroidales bacterium]
MHSDNFWHQIEKPVFTLAPMEDVTDTVFREIVLGVSDPSCLHVLFSEFMSTHGFVHAIGGPRVKHRIQINDSEWELLKKTGVKIVAQIWGTDPDKFAQTAREISEEGKFDGIDINMGCPVRKIVKQGGCSALIGMPELAKEIIYATQEASSVPVSVKTRIGLKKVVTEEWIGYLLETNPVLITIHGRIQKQQSEGLADWDEVAKAVALRDSMGSSTLIHGNGDVMSYQEGLEKAKEYNVDGIMIGRGIFHNPWFFNKEIIERSPEERLNLLWKHSHLFTSTWRTSKSFNILKRFFKIYTSDFYGAAQIRAKLMETNSMEEVKIVLENLDYELDLL